MCGQLWHPIAQNVITALITYYKKQKIKKIKQSNTTNNTERIKWQAPIFVY